MDGPRRQQMSAMIELTSVAGDRVSLQLWGDIIMEHLHAFAERIDTSARRLFKWKNNHPCSSVAQW
jgi:hypothetical protein